MGLESGKLWVNPIQALVNNTLERSRLMGNQMETKDKAGQTVRKWHFGEERQSSKAVSSFSTSKFLLPPETGLPRGWCCKSGLEPPLLTWEKYGCLYEKRGAWDYGGSPKGGGQGAGLAFRLGPQESSGAEVVQSNPPGRPTPEGLGPGSWR